MAARFALAHALRMQRLAAHVAPRCPGGICPSTRSSPTRRLPEKTQTLQRALRSRCARCRNSLVRTGSASTVLAGAQTDAVSRLPHAGQLRQSWAPAAFVVSFKLETDDDILRVKAETALRRYRVHAVVRRASSSQGGPYAVLSLSCRAGGQRAVDKNAARASCDCRGRRGRWGVVAVSGGVAARVGCRHRAGACGRNRGLA